MNPMLHPYEIVQPPAVLIMNDSYNHVPLLAGIISLPLLLFYLVTNTAIGTNLDEESRFLCPDYPNGLNASDYLDHLTDLFGDDRAQQLYEVTFTL
jgi:hypothetical protein